MMNSYCGTHFLNALYAFLIFMQTGVYIYMYEYIRSVSFLLLSELTYELFLVDSGLTHHANMSV